MAHQPIGLEGLDHILVENMRKKNLHPAEVALLPEGGGWLLVEFGADTPRSMPGAGPAADRADAAQSHPPTMKLFDQPKEAGQNLDGTRIRPGCDRHRSRRASPLGGLGGRCCATGKAGWLPARLLPAGQKLWLHHCPLRPLRAGLRPQPDRLRPGQPRGHQQVPGVHGGSGGHGGRLMVAPSRESMETGRREGNCCRRCSVRSLCRLSANSRPSGTRKGR